MIRMIEYFNPVLFTLSLASKGHPAHLSLFICPLKSFRCMLREQNSFNMDMSKTVVKEKHLLKTAKSQCINLNSRVHLPQLG